MRNLTASLELVARAQAGDEDALERLFARYYPRVFRVVRARMGARLRALEAPEDIVQKPSSWPCAPCSASRRARTRP